MSDHGGMTTTMKDIKVYLPPDVWRKIKIRATCEGKNSSQLLRELVRIYLGDGGDDE